MKRIWMGAAVAAAQACLVAAPAGADDNGGFGRFKPLSPNHTNYGVAQLNYGTLPGAPGVIRLMNPGPVTQVAALLVYSRHLEGGPQPDTNPTEVFQGCLVRELTSHAALDIGEEFVPEDDVGGLLSAPPRRYAEVIWAPVDPVRGLLRLTRVADGLGGASFFSDNLVVAQGHLAHPSLFTLPSDDVVPGQRQAAIDCICGGLFAVDASYGDVFKEFGVDCDNNF